MWITTTTKIEEICKAKRTGWVWPSNSINTSSALYFRTSSRVTGPSPAILPSAHTHCSATLIDDDFNSCTNFGIAPAFATVNVWADVPEAMLVKAHAASNCRSGLWNRIKNGSEILQKIHLFFRRKYKFCRPIHHIYNSLERKANKHGSKLTLASPKTWCKWERCHNRSMHRSVDCAPGWGSYVRLA